MPLTHRHASTLADDAGLLALRHALAMLDLEWIPDDNPAAEAVIDVALLTAVRTMRTGLERRESSLRESLARRGVDADTVARALGVDEGAEERWRSRRGLARPVSARAA